MNESKIDMVRMRIEGIEDKFLWNRVCFEYY